MSSPTSLAAFGGAPVLVPDVEPLPPPVMVQEAPPLRVEAKPAGPTIRVRYPGPIGPVERRLSWVQGKRLQHYFKEAQLIGTRLRCRLLNGRGARIRMAYIPEENELISLVRVR